MKVTYQWLKDFVDIRIAPRELAEKLTMAGLEVVSLEEAEGDVIFEIEITSNRPDWLSVVGIAREVAAVTGKTIKRSPGRKVTRSSGQRKEICSIKIEDKLDCPLYTAKIIQGVKVGASPEWLKKRLELVGCRSVNNVVDITNYLLFELGEPLHAFDMDTLEGSVIMVRKAKSNEKIVSIDAVPRPLYQEVLVIADEKKPVAIAGIMGGKDTEVTERTTNILLEGAVFNPVVVRRGRQKLGLQSEAAYRFERGVDCGTVFEASARATALILEHCGGKLCAVQQAGSPVIRKNRVVVSVDRLNTMLGTTIPAASIKNILTWLNFSVSARGKDALQITVPSHRADVRSDVDVVEEVARIYGFENIPATLPQVTPQRSAPDTKDLVALIKNTLVGLGLNEAITYSLTDCQTAHRFVEAEPIVVANPLSKDQEALRTSLIPGLVKSAAFNLNQKQDAVMLFEAGDIFCEDRNGPQESMELGILLCGTRSLLLSAGLIKEELGLLHLKGIVESLLQRLGIASYGFQYDDGNAITLSAQGKTIGRLQQLERNELELFEIKNNQVVVALLDLGRLLPLATLTKKISSLPVFPGITRDISVLVSEQTSAAEMLLAVQQSAGLLLQEVRIIDYYQGKQIPSGQRSLTFSCLFRAHNRTLTESEINPLMVSLADLLSKRFGARIR
ncbi:MAG: phenylalanine--tRNA ligase subunit beta [Candidatus Omnitrophica bacterium]|nr:phenylalanine--tRNA ligase subunit beta [Candidatus Omnitrophota bacterium]